MTALSGSEKASVCVGYLSQFFGMPVILPSMLWKGAGAESSTRPHLARAIDLHVLTLALALGLVFASSAFSDNDPFKATLIAVRRVMPGGRRLRVRGAPRHPTQMDVASSPVEALDAELLGVALPA